MRSRRMTSLTLVHYLLYGKVTERITRGMPYEAASEAGDG